MQVYLHATSSGGQQLVNVLGMSKNITKDIAFLESLVYPLADTGTTNRRPPLVRFVIPGWVNQRVVVTSVSSVYKKFSACMRLQVATVDLTLVEVPEKPLTSADIRNNGASGRPWLLGLMMDTGAMEEN